MRNGGVAERPEHDGSVDRVGREAAAAPASLAGAGQERTVLPQTVPVPQAEKNDKEGSRSHSEGEGAAEPSESGEILDSDAEDTAAGAPPPEVATGPGGIGQLSLKNRDVSSGGGAASSAHGSATPRSMRSAAGHSGAVHASRRADAGRPMHGSHDWERERGRDRERDRLYDDARVSSRNGGFGGMRGAPEYKDDARYGMHAVVPPRRGLEGEFSPQPAHLMDHRPERWERDGGNKRDGPLYDARWERERYERLDRFDGERWETAHASHGGAEWPTSPGMKGGYRGLPRASGAAPSPMRAGAMPSRESYPSDDWERGRMGPPPVAGGAPGASPVPGGQGPPPRRDWSMERAGPPRGGGVDGGEWECRAYPPGSRPVGRF